LGAALWFIAFGITQQYQPVPTRSPQPVQSHGLTPEGVHTVNSGLQQLVFPGHAPQLVTTPQKPASQTVCGVP
jgi:hypothetical protein